MKSALSLILAFVLSGVALAESPIIAVDVTNLTDGHYVLVKNGGQVYLRPLVLVSPDVTPVPPAPVPGPLSDRAKLFKASVAKIADAQRTKAPAVAALYREMAKTARAGTFKDQVTLSAATKLATDMVLGTNAADAAAWAETRTILGDQWTQLAQSGTPFSSYADLLDDAAAGIEAASPKAIDPEMLKLILEIVKIIIALFIKPV